MIATVREGTTMVDLVQRARDGEQVAWDEIVDRYAALVWAVCRRHGLSGADAEDVGSCVWLRLVERLSRADDRRRIARAQAPDRVVPRC